MKGHYKLDEIYFSPPRFCLIRQLGFGIVFQKTAHAQKREYTSPPLQSTRRCYTHAFFAAHLLVMSLIALNSFGQIPEIETPKPATFQPVQINPTTNTNISIPNNSTNQRQLDQYEQDKRELQQRDAELYKSIYGEFGNTKINYDLPSLSKYAGTEFYREAAKELNNSLNGTKTLSLKQAIFLIENAYFGGQLDYNAFDKEIQDLIDIAKLKALQDGIDWNNPQTRNVMLFRAMSDTLTIKSIAEEKNITSYPMQYDFDDYTGDKNWSKMFVSKLLATHSGQCHSMPLLYLILCEETNTPANLAFSPSHSYVKFKGENDEWYNLELTNGHNVSDAYILGSGYITAEALKSHIYMEPLTKEQTIAQCLADLARGYTKKYGYDTFVSQCVDSTLKYDPTNTFARQIKSDYQTLRFEYVVNQVGRPHPDILKAKYPKVYQLLEERNQTYQIIDASGYQEMPKEAYEAWLKSVDKQKEKQELQMFNLTRTIK